MEGALQFREEFLDLVLDEGGLLGLVHAGCRLFEIKIKMSFVSFYGIIIKSEQ